MMMAKILVIEDDVNIRESVIELLEMEEYRVISAKNGPEGVQLAISENPDIVICDVMMPGMSGHEVLKTLSNGNERPIPFIFLSALVSKDDVSTGMNLGAIDYLIKPFRAQELFDTLNRVLKR